LVTQGLTLGLGLLAVVFGWRSPEEMTLAVAALTPLLPGLSRLAGDIPGTPVLLVVGLAALGTALAGRIARGERSALPASLTKWAFSFLAVAAASCVSSIVRGETLFLLLRGGAKPVYVNTLWMTAGDRSRDAVRIFLGFVLLLAALDAFTRLARDTTQRARLLAWAAAGSALALAFAALERFLPADTEFHPWVDMGRRAGTFTDPNALGIGLAMVVPLLAVGVFAPAERGWSVGRIASAAALVFAPVALESSGSRSGLLLLLVAAGVGSIGLLRSRAVPALPVALGAAVLAGLLAGAYFFLPRGGAMAAGGLLRRIGAAFEAASFEDLANHRTFFWRTAFETMWDEPLSGCGLGGFPYEFPGRFEKRHARITVTDNATNALLDVGAECGIPALLLALGAVVPLLVKGLDAALSKRPTDLAARAGGAALTGLAVAAQTGSHLRFFEVAVYAALASSFLFTPGEPAAETGAEAAPDPGLLRPRRVRLVLVVSSVLASLLVMLPSAKIDAAFRIEKWVGLYDWETAGGSKSHRWMGPKAFRRLAGEKNLKLVFANRRPDASAVLVTADVDGAMRQSVGISPGETRELVFASLPEAGTIRVRAAPSFVPYCVTGEHDLRNLAVMLLWDSGGGL
jgi:O-Antigen ligase